MVMTGAAGHRPGRETGQELHVSRMKRAGAYDETPGKLWPLLQADLRVHRTWLSSLRSSGRTA
jgi:hypothetical protein